MARLSKIELMDTDNSVVISEGGGGGGRRGGADKW